MIQKIKNRIIIATVLLGVTTISFSGAQTNSEQSKIEQLQQQLVLENKANFPKIILDKETGLAIFAEKGGESVARDYYAILKQHQEVFCQLAGCPIHRELIVMYVFSSLKNFQNFYRKLTLRREDVDLRGIMLPIDRAIYLPNRLYINMLVNVEDNPNPLKTAIHEGTHTFLRCSFDNCQQFPSYLDEGLAMLFSGQLLSYLNSKTIFNKESPLFTSLKQGIPDSHRLGSLLVLYLVYRDKGVDKIFQYLKAGHKGGGGGFADKTAEDLEALVKEIFKAPSDQIIEEMNTWYREFENIPIAKLKEVLYQKLKNRGVPTEIIKLILPPLGWPCPYQLPQKEKIKVIYIFNGSNRNMNKVGGIEKTSVLYGLRDLRNNIFLVEKSVSCATGKDFDFEGKKLKCPKKGGAVVVIDDKVYNPDPERGLDREKIFKDIQFLTTK